MFVLNRAMRYGLAGVAAVALVTGLAAPAAAQEPTDPNPGSITVTGGIDFLNTYMFRGIRQDDSGLITWPYADLGLAVYSGDGGLKSVGINFGTWNSLHTGDTARTARAASCGTSRTSTRPSPSASAAAWRLGTTYTAYTSPNSTFTTVKEISFKLATDDSAYLGRMAHEALCPGRVRVRHRTRRRAGGRRARTAGKYLELGVAPGYSATRASLAFPSKSV